MRHAAKWSAWGSLPYRSVEREPAVMFLTVARGPLFPGHHRLFVTDEEQVLRAMRGFHYRAENPAAHHAGEPIVGDFGGRIGGFAFPV